MVANPRLVANAMRNTLYALGVAAVIAALIVVGIEIARTNKPVVAPAAPHSFVWSDRVPLSNAMFKKWLGERGAKFRAWAKLHPDAARRLARKNTAAR
jgi:hypothetical protein